MLKIILLTNKDVEIIVSTNKDVENNLVDKQMEYDEKKHSYDSTALQLQSNMSKVEGEVLRSRSKETN